MTEFERGQWFAFNKVLHLINTYDLRLVPKGDLYDDVMELRPTQRDNNDPETKGPEPHEAVGKYLPS